MKVKDAMHKGVDWVNPNTPINTGTLISVKVELYYARYLYVIRCFR
jgi:hypothetical protein